MRLPKLITMRAESGAARGVLRPGYLLGLLGISSAYIATAKLGLDLSVAHGVITPVWAPSGIALASLLLFGRRFWPAVALGALIANATSGPDPAVAAGIAVGNTLEAIVGAYLLQRVGFRASLDRVRHVLQLVVLGAGLATLISATNGVTVLILSGNAPASLGSDWVLWWFGDAVGIMLVAPLLLVAFSAERSRPSRARLLEALVLVACMVTVSPFFLGGAWHYPYLIFPLLLWSVLRFHQLGAATSSFVVGAIVTWGTVAGTLTFSGGDTTQRVQMIQVLVSALSVALLIVGATLAEREAANERLRQTTAQLSEAQALTHIGSWEWDIVGDEVTWSDELYRIWGIAPDRFGASRAAYLETVHPDDRAQVKAIIELAVKTGRGADYDCRILRSDGAERVVHARCKVVTDRSGRPVKMLGTSQDVTAEKEIEAGRERLLAKERTQNARLRELDRMKDTFLASVSHELRTPLTSIIGFVSLLNNDDEELTETQRNYLAIVERNSERLQRLVGDLLFVAQASSEHPALQPSRVDLRSVVADCIQSMRGRADQAGVELVQTGSQVPAVEGDPAWLEQVVENLVSNAIKYSTEGGRVEVCTTATADRAVLEVTDSGIGIPSAEQPYVFERFFRSSNAAERAIQGTGLGLAIAKVVVEAHGGTIELESGMAKGTKVRVELPLASNGAERRERSEVA
jgi:PAS domain S-box-containing protein